MPESRTEVAEGPEGPVGPVGPVGPDAPVDTGEHRPSPVRPRSFGNRRGRATRHRPGRGSPLRPSSGLLPHLVLGLLAAGQAAYLLYLAHDLWFVWGDDYDFFLLRGTIPSVNVGLWAPHDDHWMTSVVLIDRFLFWWVGLHSYLPYAAVTIGLHLLTVVVGYLLMLRLGARPWAAVAASVVGLFAGVGAQAVLWNTTTGLVGALTCGVLAAYLLERRDDTFRGRLPGVLVLVVGLTFSGTGVVAVFFVGVLVLVRRGWRAAVGVVAVPAAVFVIWYLAYGHSGAKAALTDRWDYLGVTHYVWLGVTSALEGASGIDGSGPVLLLGLIATVLLAPARVPLGLRALGFAGLLGALGQLTLAAVSRPSFGDEAFAGGRYAYLTLMFLVPAVAVAVAAVGPLVTAPRVLSATLAVFVLVAYVVHAADLFHSEQQNREFVTAGWPGLMKGLRAAAHDGELVLTPDTPPPDAVHGRFRADLAARKEFWDAIPSGDPTPEERLAAENLFFTGVDTEAFSVGSGAELRPALGFTTTTPIESGCRTITTSGSIATVAIDTGPDGAQFGVSGPSGTVVSHIVRDGVESPERTWPISAGRGYWVATTAQNAELVVNVMAAGDYEFCKL